MTLEQYLREAKERLKPSDPRLTGIAKIVADDIDYAMRENCGCMDDSTLASLHGDFQELVLRRLERVRYDATDDVPKLIEIIETMRKALQMYQSLPELRAYADGAFAKCEDIARRQA